MIFVWPWNSYTQTKLKQQANQYKNFTGLANGLKCAGVLVGLAYMQLIPSLQKDCRKFSMTRGNRNWVTDWRQTAKRQQNGESMFWLLLMFFYFLLIKQMTSTNRNLFQSQTNIPAFLYILRKTSILSPKLYIDYMYRNLPVRYDYNPVIIFHNNSNL